MTLLELYEKLCTGEIKLDESLWWTICLHIDVYTGLEFGDIIIQDRYQVYPSCSFNTERETFLLLFAAYKGEL